MKARGIARHVTSTRRRAHGGLAVETVVRPSGAAMSGWSVLALAVLLCVEVCHSGVAPVTGIHGAAKRNELGELRRLLDRGVNVNKVTQGQITALMWAAAEGHVEAAQMLISAGADTAPKSSCERIAPCDSGQPCALVYGSSVRPPTNVDLFVHVPAVGADALQLARQSISDPTVLAEMEVVLTGKKAQTSGQDAPVDASKCTLPPSNQQHASLGRYCLRGVHYVGRVASCAWYRGQGVFYMQRRPGQH